jgi:hypothetical protein
MGMTNLESAWAQGTDTSATLPAEKKDVSAEMEARWGIRLIAIRPSAAGFMLDFRYRVLDINKAAPLLDRKHQPFLTVEKTGAKLLVPAPPNIGSLRQTPRHLKGERELFILFANPGRQVQAGDKVTVVIGDFRAEHLTVVE